MKRTLILHILLGLASVAYMTLAIDSVCAQARQLTREDPKTKRIALVIGNGNYEFARKLSNPVNDATDMKTTLEELGFEVISGIDLTRRQMATKVREFGDRLRITKGVGLVYYAGHGVQVDGNNYLIPVDAEIPREDEVKFATLNLNAVMEKMDTANNGLNIVILDACRNNPFARGWSRSADDGGLAQVSAPSGTFIAYATAPNMTASDGNGRNGLYTAELLKQLRKPGLSIEQAFKQVTIAVDQSSGGKQVPWTSSSLRGEFYFNAEGKELTSLSTRENPTVVKKATVEKEPEDKKPSAAETASWNYVKDSQNVTDLNFYLEEFPNGFYSATARKKIAAIKGAASRKISQSEQKAWDAVKDSNDRDKIAGYLAKYPKGKNALIARIILKRLPVKKEPVSISPGTVRTNGIGMALVYIPSGSFLMGSPENEKWRGKDEGPQRKVTISKPFWMGKYEVTQDEYQKVMNINPSKFKGCGECPVEQVSWNDAKEFIQKLNESGDGFEYRLPSEAEWEYAARAGTTSAFATDNANVRPRSNKEWRSMEKRTTEVGSYAPNAFGLFDMRGNVREFVEDIYNKAGYQGLPTDGSANVTIGDTKYRVDRGGSWKKYYWGSRSANRSKIEPTKRVYSVGFRVVARIK